MQMMQIPHPSLPILAGITLNRMVAFIPTEKFKTIIDDSGGLQSMWDNEGYSINGLEYEYGKWYNVDTLEKWIRAQHWGIETKGIFN